MKKTLVSNSVFNIMYKGVDALFPLISATYISHVLLAEGVGKVAYANSIVTYFISIASLGIPNYGVKAIAQHRQNDLGKTKCFWELFSINCVSTMVCLCFYYLLVNGMPYFEQKQPLLNIMGLMLFLNLFNIDWYFQGIEEYGYIAVRSIVIKVLSFIAILLFVRSAEDYLVYALILCIALGGNYVLNLLSLRKSITFCIHGLDYKKHLKPVFVLLASAMATKIYTTLDTVMLEYFGGEAYVAYYSNPMKIVRMVYTVAIAAVTPFFPKISLYLKTKQYEKSNKLLKDGLEIVLILALPCVVGIFLTSEHIVHVMFGESFLPSIATMRILCVLVVVFSIAYFLGHIVLIAAGKEKAILKATALGAVINFMLNWLLIPISKHNGAAAASVIAEMVVTLLLLSQARKTYKIRIGRKYWVSLLSANVLMALVVGIVCGVLQTTIIGLLVAICTGSVVYVVGLIAFKNPFAEELLGKVKEKRLLKETDKGG